MRIILTAIATLLFVHPAAAQWSWPERSENLQVLPSDFDGQRLRAVMQGFTRALGVRCSHCHVGEEGRPLSEYDFVSDSNPNKDVARAMLEMLGSINEQLEAIDFDRPDRVNMWCHTCHRGVARPQTLEEALLEAYDRDGADGAMDRYAALRDRYFGRGAYDFGVGSLDAFARTVLSRSDTTGAVRAARLNVETNARSPTAWVGLADMHIAAGRTEEARAALERALELDPTNRQALRRLGDL